jgi:hypothetical protein
VVVNSKTGRETAKTVPYASESVATHFGKYCQFNLFYFPVSKAQRHTAANAHVDRRRSERHAVIKLSPDVLRQGNTCWLRIVLKFSLLIC